MKIFTILTASTSLFGVFASAAPLSALDTRAFQVFVTFYGADGGTFFSQSFLANKDPIKITSPASYLSGGAICFFTGIDGSFTILEYQETIEADVSPLQAQISGFCIQ